MRFLMLAFLTFAACGGETPAPQTKTAATAPKPAGPPATPAAEVVGPDGPSDLAIPEITLSDDDKVVERGEAVFKEKGCGACHKFGEKLVGPDLKGVTERRSVKWIARMIKYPEIMTKRDPVAKDLFRTLMVQMSAQGVLDEDLGPVISYIRHEGK